MALFEAVLTYRPHLIGNESPIPLGTTSAVAVLRLLRDHLLAEAEAQAVLWERIDPGLRAIKRAEADRLRFVLDTVLPEREIRPALHVVEKAP